MSDVGTAVAADAPPVSGNINWVWRPQIGPAVEAQRHRRQAHRRTRLHHTGRASPVPPSHEEGLVIIRDACSEALRGVYIVVGRRN
jgi:hypothetical protein